MSTRTTIYHTHDSASGAAVHLYSDWVDDADILYLEVTGALFAASASPGRTVQLALPGALAKKIGHALHLHYGQQAPTTANQTGG